MDFQILQGNITCTFHINVSLPSLIIMLRNEYNIMNTARNTHCYCFISVGFGYCVHLLNVTHEICLNSYKA